jgi:putative membrane protein
MSWLTQTTERGTTSRLLRALVGALAVALTPASALAHSGPPPVPETLWSTWNLDPFILLVLTLAVWAYIRGVRAIWSRAGRGNGVRTWQVAAGLSGYLTIFIALISPLDPLGTALFSAHMAQHILLITVAPLLLVLADVSSTSIWALPAQWRQRIPDLWRQAGSAQGIWRFIARPLPALALHSFVLWAWHVPVLYDAAIRIELIHWIEHLTMFGSAALFWWIALQRGRHAVMNYGVGLLMLFGLVLQKTALGALIAFSPTPWYGEYSATTAIWGLTPFEDQQLAGAVLMGPGGFIYLVVGVTLFAGWFRAMERSGERDEAWTNPTLATDSGTNKGTKETV